MFSTSTERHIVGDRVVGGLDWDAIEAISVHLKRYGILST